MVSGLCIQIVIFLKFQWPFCLLARGSPAGFTSRRRQIEEKPEQITRYPCADLNYNRPIVFRHFLWLHISILIHRLGSSSLLPFTMSSSSCSSAYCPKEMADGAELHVLAVDDSVVERMSLERMLKNSAYKGMQSAISFSPFCYILLLTVVNVFDKNMTSGDERFLGYNSFIVFLS
ncbi:hypothetical protein AXF42_Ash010565 [Apostasia shenzhenica]|uniref:Uncharacterized protein n=1 Tax=Apostasia shenzhenica TaxID=1088818 RepID=A0A2I0A6F7_9ASPA|nr:hypothetical protein AXF42_Ash010565 [Apostasia shenzhenica]